MNPSRSAGSAFHILRGSCVQRICSRRHLRCIGSLGRHNLELFYVVSYRFGAAGWSQLTDAFPWFIVSAAQMPLMALMRSATRRACAAMVRAGFTAAEDGKNEPSTTYRFGTS